MSDTVTIHNGHCSYHGPANKAPVWAARGAITDLQPPAPTMSLQIDPGPVPAQRVPDGASIAPELSGVGAHESHATRNEKALVLERKLSAPGSVHTHDQPMVEGAPSQVRKSLPKVSDVPAPKTSFEDTTHAWEEGYRAGRAEGEEKAQAISLTAYARAAKAILSSKTVHEAGAALRVLVPKDANEWLEAMVERRVEGRAKELAERNRELSAENKRLLQETRWSRKSALESKA